MAVEQIHRRYGPFAKWEDVPEGRVKCTNCGGSGNGVSVCNFVGGHRYYRDCDRCGGTGSVLK